MWKIPDAFSNAVLLRVTESNGASTTESDSLFSFISSRELVCDEWEFVGYGPFAGRDSAGALTYNHWYELENTPWPVRHAAAVYAHDSALWIIGGNNMVSDIWKLNCEFDNLANVEENKIVNIQISFYPNPVTDILNVVINKNGLFILTIFDVNGKVIINDEIEKGQNSINLKRLHSGVYFAIIRNNELNVFF